MHKDVSKPDVMPWIKLKEKKDVCNLYDQVLEAQKQQKERKKREESPSPNITQSNGKHHIQLSIMAPNVSNDNQEINLSPAKRRRVLEKIVQYKQLE